MDLVADPPTTELLVIPLHISHDFYVSQNHFFIFRFLYVYESMTDGRTWRTIRGTMEPRKAAFFKQRRRNETRLVN